MRHIGNTLYITTPDAYLSLDGETVAILKDNEVLRRVPLHNIQSIIAFGFIGASPALMGVCADRNIALTFLTMYGRFLARVTGEHHGNVVLRKQQYRFSDNKEESLKIAKNIITGKLFNSKWVIERACRDNGLRLDIDSMKEVSNGISEMMEGLQNSQSLDELRGYEGKAADLYFSVFDNLILQQKEEFKFTSRNRRPPTDNVNALLSFIYTLLAHDIASALETIGLDSYVGYLHRDRPGRISLALDMMEELRSVMADRFVLSIINKKVINGSDFKKRENGAVYLEDEARKKLLTAWQTKKNEKITHPFLNESMTWGLVPFIQAQLLARYLREDLDAYPPFLWK